jgi:hypothetical protein
MPLATASAMIWITSWPNTPSLPAEGCELAPRKTPAQLRTPAENSPSNGPTLRHDGNVFARRSGQINRLALF